MSEPITPAVVIGAAPWFIVVALYVVAVYTATWLLKVLGVEW